MSRTRRILSAVVGLLALPALLLVSSAPAAAGIEPAVKIATDCSPQPLHRGEFPGVPNVDNRFLPYLPGSQLVLDGVVVDEAGVSHPHRIVTTVTDLTKVVDGVDAVVVLDVDIEDGAVIESELFFVAQRGDGSVWTLGEYPEEYEDGRLTGAPSTWIAGTAGARAGIAMQGHPQVGTPTYLQGFSPDIDFKDCATVVKVGQSTCVPAGCFDHVVVTDEFAPLDPEGGHQRKLSAPGVGVVRVGAAGGVDPEELQLTSATTLCGTDLAKVRRQVLAQDGRGYRVARDVYSDTARATRTLVAPGCVK